MRARTATLILLAALAAAAGAAHAAAVDPHPDRPVARQRQNFNAGWRFHLGDIGGAEKPGYDDADWQAVGLPHSFSMPYFQAPEAPGLALAL